MPVLPANSYASAAEKNNPYPYDPAKAAADLKDNGWKVVPNGTDTCIKPGTAKGDCGAGIKKGTPLTLNLQVASGSTPLTQEVTAEKSAWSSDGINVNVTYASFNTVIGNATACPKGCSWEMEDWGGGWTFAPDYYPSGEDLFSLGSVADYGDYDNATNQKLIEATDDTNVSLTKWENYLAKQLPDVWQPNEAYTILETQKGLTGTTPQNVYTALTPENWRWK